MHALAENPDQTVIARPAHCPHCRAALTDADQRLAQRYDKIDLPPIKPIVTRVERYAGHCPCCGVTTLAAVPEGMESGTPFSLNLVALAIYLRVIHAVSYRRLSRLFTELFALAISEGALDAAFRRARSGFEADVGAILARLRRARVVCSDETSVRINGRTHWNWAELPKILCGWRTAGFRLRSLPPNQEMPDAEHRTPNPDRPPGGCHRR